MSRDLLELSHLCVPLCVEDVDVWLWVLRSVEARTSINQIPHLYCEAALMCVLDRVKGQMRRAL